MLREVEHYELHDFSSLLSHARRRLSSSSTESIRLDVLGRSLTVSLKRDTELFDPKYSHVYLDENSKEVKQEGALDCFYQASFGDEINAKGAFAMCDDRQLLATVYGELTFTIEPVTVKHSGRNTEELVHAVYWHDDVRTNVANMTMMVFPPKVESTNPLGDGAFANAVASGTFTDSKTKYLGMLVVNDVANYKRLGSQVNVKGAQTIAASKAYYELLPADAPYRISLRIAQMATFTVKDPYTATFTSDGRVNDSPLLGIFGQWLQSSSFQADAAILLVGTGFANAAGWGFVGTVCDSANLYNVAIIDATGSDGGSGSVAAHEIGHVLGAQHDNVVVPSLGHDCNANTGIMGRRLQATQFSPCTIEWWKTQFTPGKGGYNTANNPACLEGIDFTTPTGPVCGDGLVEGDEQCDCVGNNCKNDPCCDGATCRFKGAATCAAHQPCCDLTTCSAKAAGITCRASTGQCDVAETCDGTSPTCPVDARKPIGTTCTRTIAGNAISGTCTCEGCMTLTEKCRLSDPTYVSVCTWLSTGDDACDSIWCQDSSEDCSGYNQPTPTGMACGSGMACSNKKCVPASQVVCPGTVVAAPTAANTPAPTPKPTGKPTLNPTTKTPTLAPTTKSPVPPTVRRRRRKARRGLLDGEVVFSEELSA